MVASSGRVAVTAMLVVAVLLPGVGAYEYSYPGDGEDEASMEKSKLGQMKLREFQRKTEVSDCWGQAVMQLNSTCRLLGDLEQSRLAVAFSNCHLEKSGRPTHTCYASMTIRQCTGNMDAVAFQTYTEFFTHTSHICYFLQSQLWQRHTHSTISRLSEASSQSVEKLELALDYHQMLEKKQDQTLQRQENILEHDRAMARTLKETRDNMEAAFRSMEQMATKQQDLLAEVYGALKTSIDHLRYMLSLCLVQLIGYETLGMAIGTWLAILFLPRVGHSRFKLYLLLGAELTVEVVARRLYVYAILRATASTATRPDMVRDCHILSK